MWLQEIVQFQQGESLRHWELGLGPFLSITRLEMKNPAVVCSDCKTTEKMLTSQIHHHPVFFFLCSLMGVAIGVWGERLCWWPSQLPQQLLHWAVP